MSRLLVAAVAGLIFGLGLAVSEMVNPQKVLGFLDVAGNWDPSLALVMGGALLVTGGTFGFILKRPGPLFDVSFHVPTRHDIDAKLLLGAGIFGLGWGIVGICPGPAIAGLAYGHMGSVWFVLAMFGGFALHRAYNHFF